MASESSSPIPVVGTVASPFETEEGQNPGRKPLSLWPGMYHSPVTAALWETRARIFETLVDPPLHAPPQTQLLTKTPSYSRTSIRYNFSSDHILREQYRDPWNEVRIGKLLEDLDALAGTISVKVVFLPSFSFNFPFLSPSFSLSHSDSVYPPQIKIGSTVLMMMLPPGPSCLSLLPWTGWCSRSLSALTLISKFPVLSSGLATLPLKFSFKSLNPRLVFFFITISASCPHSFSFFG